MPKHDTTTGLNAGLPDHRGLDETGRRLLEEKLNRTYEPNVVGNFADLQKAGSPNHPAETVADAAAESAPYQEAEDATKATKSTKKK